MLTVGEIAGFPPVAFLHLFLVIGLLDRHMVPRIICMSQSSF
jgi:hypothetical protein